MTKAQAIRRAAKIFHAERYGLEHPDDAYGSVDAILLQFCPDYNQDPEHTARWHDLKRDVITRADELVVRHCPCGRSLSRRQKTYCSIKCSGRGKRGVRRCEHCAHALVRRVTEGGRDWCVRRFCSVKCVRLSGANVVAASLNRNRIRRFTGHAVTSQEDAKRIAVLRAAELEITNNARAREAMGLGPC